MADKGKTAKSEDIGWAEMGWGERVAYSLGMAVALVGFILWVAWNIFWPIFSLVLNILWGLIAGVLAALTLGGRSKW